MLDRPERSKSGTSPESTGYAFRGFTIRLRSESASIHAALFEEEGVRLVGRGHGEVLLLALD